MELLFIASMEKKKSEDTSICHPYSFSILLFSSRKAVKEAPANFLHKKGFINFVFCRNWAVRNPAGTRLDSSSLVNKQVAVEPAVKATEEGAIEDAVEEGAVEEGAIEEAVGGAVVGPNSSLGFIFLGCCTGVWTSVMFRLV